jgi:hypothetical protein
VLVLVALALTVAGWRELQQQLATTPPVVEEIDVLDLFTDTSPIVVTFTVDWRKSPVIVTHDELRRTPSIWRYMHFEDWDAVPAAIRNDALDAMFRRYEHLLTDPDVWDRMGPRGWDAVPQPMRALAYRHMCAYWSGYYDVGADYDIPRGLMADTLSAIVMAESWFDHRAVNSNQWGNRDLGVAQASDFARDRMRELYTQDVVDVFFSDADYFDPWEGTRFVAIWIDLLLEDVGGDLEMAIRAYHRGVPRALVREEVAESYLQTVLRRRNRYIRNQGVSPSWSYLWHRDRELIGDAWPWIRARRDRERPLLPARPLTRSGDPPWKGDKIAPGPRSDLLRDPVRPCARACRGSTGAGAGIARRGLPRSHSTRPGHDRASDAVNG